MTAHTPGPDGFEHYERGEHVEAFDVHARTWRPAMIAEDKPYPRAKTGGAYILWRDITEAGRRDWVSSGGWVGSNSIRRAAIAKAKEQKDHEGQVGA